MTPLRAATTKFFPATATPCAPKFEKLRCQASRPAILPGLGSSSVGLAVLLEQPAARGGDDRVAE